MKLKPLVALIATAVCGLANAADAPAPTVQVFGVLDAAVTSISADGNGTQTSLVSDGNSSSRLGFKGSESLGNGLSANFWLEGAVALDTGNSGTTSTNNNDSVTGAWMSRRATVGLSGSWGEVRLGRDYTPTFTNLTTAMHPFGTNGLANAGQLFYPVSTGGTTVRTNVRASNSVGYFIPTNAYGIYGQAMYATGEQLSSAGATSENGNYIGARLGYKNGAWDVAAASGKTNYSTGDVNQNNLGFNYTYGPAKIMYLWGENKVGSTKTTANMIGVQYTIGTGEIRADYTALSASGVANDANQFAIGYVHNLSKRTALYTNYSIVKNEGKGTTFTVGDGQKTTTPGGSVSGYQFGLRHSF